MKKREEKRSKLKSILLTIAAVLFVVFFIIPITFSAFSNFDYGNVALIPIEGIITGSGGSYLGSSTISSKSIVEFIEEADKSDNIDAIVLEINSPGGSAVASDEIAAAVKNAKKPVVSFIREVGASGGYWVASASDYIIANRMSITGSIGVISSYLEFSGLMEKYGVGYERLVAGENKDLLSPYTKLEENKKAIVQKKLDTIHDFFIQEVAANRKLSEAKVKSIATGEFFLGVEAFNLGLIDQLGDKTTVEQYLKQKYGLEKVDFVTYQRKIGFLEMLSGVFSDYFFKIGEGIGSIFLRTDENILMQV